MITSSPMASTFTTPPNLTEILEEIYNQCLELQDGQVATYIPELAKVNPNAFGIAVVTVAGQVFSVGDVQQVFTIQSISKPFMYGLALEDCGRAAVLERIGVEPTGEAFNSIVLNEKSNRPGNPMTNAGAIATADLVQGQTPSERLNRMLEMFSRYTGHKMSVDISVFTSERMTTHKNRATAHLMHHFKMIGPHIEEILDLYLQQCSVQVSCQDLAKMAATLARGGTHPDTLERALSPDYVRDVLSLMYTCGMYDFAGEWAYRVGLPAKSGVGGGLLAVAPGKLGIGIFSPRLDSHGHSVRGVKACELIAGALNLHIFDMN